MRSKMPKLYNHLSRMEGGFAPLTTSWFSAAFATTLPAEVPALAPLPLPFPFSHLHATPSATRRPLPASRIVRRHPAQAMLSRSTLREPLVKSTGSTPALPAALFTAARLHLEIHAISTDCSSSAVRHRPYPRVMTWPGGGAALHAAAHLTAHPADDGNPPPPCNAYWAHTLLAAGRCVLSHMPAILALAMSLIRPVLPADTPRMLLPADHGASVGRSHAGGAHGAAAPGPRAA